MASIVKPRSGGWRSNFFKLVANTSTAALSAFRLSSDLMVRAMNGKTVKLSDRRKAFINLHTKYNISKTFFGVTVKITTKDIIL